MPDKHEVPKRATRATSRSQYQEFISAKSRGGCKKKEKKKERNASNAFARMKDPKGRKKAHTVRRASIGRLSLEQRHEARHFSHGRDAVCLHVATLCVSRECVEETRGRRVRRGTPMEQLAPHRSNLYLVPSLAEIPRKE